MSLFEGRERAFERGLSRTNIFGFAPAPDAIESLQLWAAERMALGADAGAAYEQFIIQLGAFYGDQGVRERLLHDLENAGKPISDHRIRRMMDEGIAAEIASALRSQNAALLAH